MLLAQIIFWGAISLYAIIGGFVALDNWGLNLREPPWYPKPHPLYVGALWFPLAAQEWLDRRGRTRA